MSCTIPLNLEQSCFLDRTCDSILALDNRIIFVASISKHGRVLETKTRENKSIEQLFEKDLEMLFMQKVLQNSMIKEFDSKLGLFQCMFVERDLMTEMLFPFRGGVFLVITKIQEYPKETARKISKLINDFFLFDEVKA
jgi:hypothetical protein